METLTTTKQNRNLSEIARDILNNWKNPSQYAKPYLKAMLTINSSDPNARYLFETAGDIVAYFLANATTFRGPDARRIKQELKSNYNIK